MSKVIIYDYEVFMKDTLCGCNIIDENGKEEIFQTWDLEENKKFYFDHINDLWVGHHNYGYDDHIIDSIVNNENPYITSRKIVNKENVPKIKIKLYSVDLMKLLNNYSDLDLSESNRSSYSLKLTELLCGKDIRTTEVPFDLDRKLTEEEKRKTEFYNLADLNQTTYNYNMFYDVIKLKFDIIKEFNLNLEKSLPMSGTELASNILGAKYTPALKYATLKPVLYENLKLNNKELINFYLSGAFKKGEQLIINVSGANITISGGGSHSALKKINVEKLLYADVSGYYNLIAILYDLLPRSLSPEGKEKYKQMYEEQLKLKQTNPTKREAYKVILLAVIGSMKKENSPFYDPESYQLLSITGQLFIVDLLEKLEGLVTVIQTNTDGIMIKPLNWDDKDKIINIIKEWECRTGFSIKLETLTNLWQRDVNCYCCLNEKKQVIAKGDILKNYDIGKEAYANQDFFNCKEPPIIAQGIVNYLIYGKEPEKYVEEKKKDLKLFQYPCKKAGFDYTTYDTVNLSTMEHFTEKLQGMDRAFAFNSNNIVGSVIKHKNRYGKHSQQKIPNLPDNVFIYNGNLENAYEEIGDKIDYQYYVKRIYQKVLEFIE